MKQILTILFISATVASCKKSSTDDGYYTITGLVLDWDSKAPIAGAKVFSESLFTLPIALDSAVSDASGRVIFKFLKSQTGPILYAIKPGYEYPFYSLIIGVRVNNIVDQTDTIFMARASNLNLTLHQAGSYISTDSMHVWISGYRKAIYFVGGDPMTKVDLLELDRRAMAPDSLLNFSTVYFNPPYQKTYFRWNIFRNGSVISGGSDSTDLIQFGTKNYNLNY
jgi:hypothetical protein